MKYRCDMVKDLIPLCLDHAATESCEQTVIEHLAECKECTKYYEALGYRISSKAAADLSGRLNDTSEVVGFFEWKDNLHFYIYDSYSCYDVVCVEKTLLGWKQFDIFLNWPKWSLYDETIGIEVAGTLCHYRYDEGVQLFSIIAYDENVKRIEATCFEQTQTKEVKTGELTLFTFDAIDGQSNTVKATAYDAAGNIIYRLEEQNNRWIWVSATE